MSSIANLLKKTLELTNKYEWIQGSLCQDSEGNEVGLNNTDIKKCCLLGYIHLAIKEITIPVGEDKYLLIDTLLRKFHKRLNYIHGITNWNDRLDTTKEDVVNLLKKELEDEEVNN